MYSLADSSRSIPALDDPGVDGPATPIPNPAAAAAADEEPPGLATRFPRELELVILLNVYCEKRLDALRASGSDFLSASREASFSGIGGGGGMGGRAAADGRRVERGGVEKADGAEIWFDGPALGGVPARSGKSDGGWAYCCTIRGIGGMFPDSFGGCGSGVRGADEVDGGRLL